ncbi:PRC and DUF2382 domain-containing protein [Streptacidiphilus sp. PB12-B1b]|uniref:PRC and DUF2382 domain-containing protein n=1 Tax=Streptacidiphilus sp. PB12-B1b TaxID=2705012 RepID=UPI0015FBD274|nr:PRC and DUF2382 domain-containing protein [Streptacidiphilus sp. PB12-B1b]QMU76283.1 PRC and DUF2382 domain-containing protein [Streptacidiphilus sp. PB12-B1b]
MQTEIDPRDLIGHKAVDRNGDKIGTIDEVYLDDATGEPEWAAVRTGLFGRDAFVPLTTSEFVSEELRVPYEKSQVKDSPDFGVGQHLSPAQELQLYRYYGLELPAGVGHDGTGNGSGSGGGNAATAGAGTGAGTGTGTGDAGAAAKPGAPAVGTAAAGAAAAAGGAMAAADLSKQTDRAGAQPAAETTQAMPTTTSAAAGGRTAAFMSPPSADRPTTPSATAPSTAAPSTTAGSAAQPMAASAAAASLASPASPASSTAASAADSGEPARSAARPAAPMGRSAAESSADARGGQGVAGDVAGTPVPEPIEFVCREERLDISTEWSVLGHARLRKYVTTEQVERRVPVVRERIRVERVPVGADERAQLTDQEIAEATEEVTLHEERVVVRKAVVPVERIRLVTERFTEEQIVRDELHREHIQVQDSTRVAGPTAVPGDPAGSSQGSSPQGSSAQGSSAQGGGQGTAPSMAAPTAMRPEPFPRTGDTGHAIGA